MRYLGIDFGEKRVGIAVSDESNIMAIPKCVLKNDKKLLENLEKIVKENTITEIILGESKNFKGEENAIMKKITAFKREVEEKIKIPVYFEPEFMTSAEAERLQGANLKSDSSAAALILKSYMMRMKNSANETNEVKNPYSPRKMRGE